MHGNMNELGKTIVDVFKIKTSIMSSQIKKKCTAFPMLQEKPLPVQPLPLRNLPCFANSISLNGGHSLHIIHLLQKCLILLQAVK